MTGRSDLRRVSAAAALAVPVALLVGACGTGGSKGPSPTATASAPCDAGAMVAALQVDYGPKVRVVYNGHLACAGDLAEISVMIDNLQSSQPGYTGPVGSPHGALMKYSRGTWLPVDLTKPNPYCTPEGQQRAAVPPGLGTVCGVQ